MLGFVCIALREINAVNTAVNIAAPALSFNNITVTFAGKSGSTSGAGYMAVKETTLNIADGEFVSVVGPTGCGKSTLLNIGAGLLQASSGEVNVFGAPLQGINTKAGYMFQAESLMPWRSTLDNVTAGLQFRGIAKEEANRRGEEWLSRVGLAGFGDRYPHQLSGGMRKRCALAQMLILDPKILLMDEPFSALDIQTRQLMENELLQLWEADKKSVLFITHDLEEAISMSDRVIVLAAGPATRPIGEFVIDLPRPRDVAEIRMTPRFLELHEKIWSAMKDEVLKGYQQTKNKLVL
jgi:NitT/TauT family transport system ATP-binding protein